jgi:hypothetical protein
VPERRLTFLIFPTLVRGKLSTTWNARGRLLGASDASAQAESAAIALSWSSSGSRTTYATGTSSSI